MRGLSRTSSEYRRSEGLGENDFLFFPFFDRGVLNPLLPFGLSSPVTEQLKLALRGKANFAACLTLGCSFYPTKKSKISLRGPLLHLPKCGTYVTFLLRVYFSHSHNRADDGTY